MKRILILGTALLLSAVSFAQHSEEIKVVKKTDVPEVVVNSVEEDYPDLGVIDWYSVPELVDFSKWEIEFDSDPYFKTHKADNYGVLLKGNDFKKYLVYDKSGKLERSKETITDAQLPVTIKNSLSNGEYKNWKVVGDKEKIIMGDTSRVYYRVKLKNGNMTKVVYFDLMGNTFHER